jgi:hypothetical protein
LRVAWELSMGLVLKFLLLARVIKAL